MDEQDQQQTTEVRETTTRNAGGNAASKQTVTSTSSNAAVQTAPGPVIAARVVYYLGGALTLLLVVRFILALFGANRDNPFASFIFDISAVFVWPFFGLFNYEPSYGTSQLELGTVVAIIIYAILTIGIAKLFTLTRRNT